MREIVCKNRKDFQFSLWTEQRWYREIIRPLPVGRGFFAYNGKRFSAISKRKFNEKGKIG